MSKRRAALEQELVEALTSADSRPFAFGAEPTLSSNSEAVSYRFLGGDLVSSLDAQAVAETLTWEVDVYSVDRGTLLRRVDAIARALLAAQFQTSLGAEELTEDATVYNLALTAQYSNG